MVETADKAQRKVACHSALFKGSTFLCEWGYLVGDSASGRKNGFRDFGESLSPCGDKDSLSHQSLYVSAAIRT